MRSHRTSWTLVDNPTLKKLGYEATFYVCEHLAVASSSKNCCNVGLDESTVWQQMYLKADVENCFRLSWSLEDT